MGFCRLRRARVRGAVLEDGYESRLETEFSPNFSDFSGLFMASAGAAW